jgi:murein DD-endopeptidase MepM/ murein hydrolase activator NlpD
VGAILGLLMLGACGGASAEPGVVLKLTTPTATPPGGAVQVGLPTPTLTPTAPPELVLSTEQVYQAGTVLVSVTGNVAGGSVTFLGRTNRLTKGTRSWYAFVGVGTEDPVGRAPLKADFALANGSKGSLTADVTVLRTQWTVDSLIFTEAQTQTFLDPKVVAAENSLLDQIYRTNTDKKLWDGPWLVPTQGALTSRFGEQRAVNGSEPSGHHGGTDLGAKEGTPVYATNSGRVVMARQLQLRGNMVIIDHGGGLLSGYGHLSAFAAAEGQDVQAGDLIGYVGNTGLSTGAHLHWEMSVNGVLVDALRFNDGSNGF